MDLTKTVAAGRRAKADRAERLAKAHGLDTVHGQTFLAEAAAWREDAARADRGELGPPWAFLKLTGPNRGE